MKTALTPALSHPEADPFGSLLHQWKNQPDSQKAEIPALQKLIQNKPAPNLFFKAGFCISPVWLLGNEKNNIANARTKVIYGKLNAHSKGRDIVYPAICTSLHYIQRIPATSQLRRYRMPCVKALLRM